MGAWQWNQVYPTDTNDPGLASSDIVSQASAAASPVTAGHPSATGNGPTVSLLMILGLLVAIRVLVDRGVKQGE